MKAAARGALLAAALAGGAAIAQQQVAHERPWSYEPPVRPVPPRDDVAPIDAFVLARLQQHDLEPAPPADPATWLRRVTLDLTGLPPTLAELDAYLADRAPGAKERVVDRLLASPHHAERMAQGWLDLARYGDTNGYNFDAPRSMWPWRDGVIAAFADDQPFDRFTVEQLAGDLLPDATERTRIATGFHRNTMLNNEGGVDPDEARWERLLDRASTTATVWLGSTFHCARCHDHKFDPITQKDFYALVAFFETQDEVELKLGGDGAKPATTLVLRERPGANAVTPLHRRGGYVDQGEPVAAGTPASLHAWPDGAAKDRLGLARWLTSPANPLFARVQVDRLWAMLMGRPLVDTPEDFGARSQRPLHQDVLDWLATEFVRLGYRNKPLIRAIVLSDTYGRSSRVTARDLEVDPQNRLFARAARFRLDAEQIRDLSLAVAGLLDEAVGGPSVFPLQADTSGIVPLNKVDTKWKPSPGGDRHRRGLYTFWRRTQLHVQMSVLDAPSREQCTVQRARTNTPLQALSLLNDPASWEAAQALGERMRSASGDDADRLRLGFRLCTARLPTEAELQRLLAALAREADGQRWALVANALLNLDETVTRG